MRAGPQDRGLTANRTTDFMDSNTSPEKPSNPVRWTGSGAPKPKCETLPATRDTQPDGPSQTAKRTRQAIAFGPALTRERRDQEQKAPATNSSGAETHFRITLCCKYGRSPAKWGRPIEGKIPAEKYQSMLDGLARDKEVVAFECERLSAPATRGAVALGPKLPRGAGSPDAPQRRLGEPSL